MPHIGVWSSCQKARLPVGAVQSWLFAADLSQLTAPDQPGQHCSDRILIQTLATTTQEQYMYASGIDSVYRQLNVVPAPCNLRSLVICH